MFLSIKAKFEKICGNSQWRWFIALYLTSLVLIGTVHTFLHWFVKWLQ